MMRVEAVLHNMLFVIAGYCSNMIRSTKQRICKARGMISHDVGKGPYDEYSLYELQLLPKCARATHPILLTISQVHCALIKKAMHSQVRYVHLFLSLIARVKLEIL